MKISGINTYKTFIDVGFSHHKHIENSKTKNRDKKVYNYAIVTTSLVVGSLAALAVYNYIKKGKVSAVSDTNSIEDTPSKFLAACKSAADYNYCSSPKNLSEGLFTRDLHSHSNHSDGYGKVADILNQVCAYADELFKKTGKKFTFALTDHDRISGVKEALDIIKKNPEKYKNVNFIPGVELSFSFISNNKVKNGEILAYFINPEAKSIKTLVEILNQNRNKMIDNCIQKLGEGFSRQDLEEYFINKDGETFAYNLHYRLRNYAQIKNRINNIAKEQSCDSAVLYKRLMDGYVFDSGRRVPKPFVSPEGFDYYLKKSTIKTNTPVFCENINTICNEFFPQIVDGKIVSETENSFEKIIDTFKNDNNVVLGFAHPYFTAKQMVNYQAEFDTLINKAREKLKVTESYHQPYPAEISKSEINAINEFLQSKNLIPIGGRDNHKETFL